MSPKNLSRSEFRKRYRNVILLVRCFLFIGVPLTYLAISGITYEIRTNQPEYRTRHLLQIIENVEPSITPIDISVFNETPQQNDTTLTNILNINETVRQNDTFVYDILKLNETYEFNNTDVKRNCTPAAILDFPSDGFTKEERQNGWIFLHVIISCYAFTLLAIVCDDYFVPSIEQICHKLGMTEDVAGATFMAIASSSPELFINSVGTFITEGDLGVGTIVGSAVFNILAVPACCGLLAGQVIDLDWWALSRDSFMYGVAVIALIFTLQDEKVMWYEALILVTAYSLYIIAMYFNQSMSRFMKTSCCGKRKSNVYTEVTPLLSAEKGEFSSKSNLNENELSEENNNINDDVGQKHEDEDESNVWSFPHDSGCFGKLFFILTWPIRLVLWLTVPNCRKYRKLFFLTFFMCIIWIGSTSYFVAWLITVIGDTINIPDSVMGLTFLAAGTSVPEAVSSIIVTNQGHGGMGISSSIGSNTFDILLCLGLPWFIKSTYNPTVPGQNWVNINSSGLTYSAISLLSTLIGLYGSFACNKFRLDWKIGLTCTFMYIAFLSLASLIELNFFFPVNLPMCPYQ